MRTHGAFISARYSTDNQNPDSIEVQVAKCSEWCQRNDLPVLGVYADYATSGMKDTRPQFAAMMRDLELGMADTVVIYDQSRMFRKMSAWFTFRDDLTAMGVSVVSVTQPAIGKDLRDPLNFLSEGSMALFNQIWALQTRQKTMEKLRYMACHGQHTGGVPALGYRVEDGRLVIAPEEAAIVRRIFEEYAAGRSYRQIIAGLNAEGLTTKRGRPFGTNSIHEMLRNEKYTGVLIYGGKPYREDGTRNTHAQTAEGAIRIEGAVPAIVDRELFDRVQAKMDENRHAQQGRPPKNLPYPLKGKVFCACCGSAMVVALSKGNYYYYRCSGKKRRHSDCPNTPIRVDKLEQLAADHVRAMLGSPSNLEQLLGNLRAQAQTLQNGAAARLADLIDQERDVAAKINNALDAVLDGFASPALKGKVKDLERQRAALQCDIRHLKAQVDASQLPEQRLRDLLQTIITAEDPAAVLAVVDKIEIGPDDIAIWTLMHNAAPSKAQDGVMINVGTPEGTRTPDLLIRSQSLYPTELPVRNCVPQSAKV